MDFTKGGGWNKRGGWKIFMKSINVEGETFHFIGSRLVLLKTLIVNSTLYVESTCVNSFKGSLGYFKAERVKYCPNLPELLTGNIC